MCIQVPLPFTAAKTYGTCSPDCAAYLPLKGFIAAAAVTTTGNGHWSQPELYFATRQPQSAKSLRQAQAEASQLTSSNDPPTGFTSALQPSCHLQALGMPLPYTTQEGFILSSHRSKKRERDLRLPWLQDELRTETSGIRKLSSLLCSCLAGKWGWHSP